MSSRRNRAPKAVVDTNILLRALVSSTGPSAALLRAAREERFKLVLSPAILSELKRAFFKPHVRRRFPLDVEDIAELIAAVEYLAHVVPGRLEVHHGSRDPKDNPILACALEGRADYIVTDDRRDLLPLKHYHGVQIISVPDFLRRLRER